MPFIWAIICSRRPKPVASVLSLPGRPSPSSRGAPLSASRVHFRSTSPVSVDKAPYLAHSSLARARLKQWSEPRSGLVRLVGPLFVLACCLSRNREQVLVLRSSIVLRRSSEYRQIASGRLRALECALQLLVLNLRTSWPVKDGRSLVRSRAGSCFDAPLPEPKSRSAPDFAFAR